MNESVVLVLVPCFPGYDWLERALLFIALTWVGAKSKTPHEKREGMCVRAILFRVVVFFVVFDTRKRLGEPITSFFLFEGQHAVWFVRVAVCPSGHSNLKKTNNLSCSQMKIAEQFYIFMCKLVGHQEKRS